MPPPNFEGSERLMMGKREGELIAPLTDGAYTLHPGEEIQVDVVVRNRRVGHRFPGGPIDLFDIWLEFQVVDDEGRIIYHIGKLTEEGMVDANDLNIRFYRGIFLDRLGNRIDKHNFWDGVKALYVAKQFPNDPVVQQEIGRTAFLKKDFSLVVRAFQEALVINPEDVIAHFYLWQAY